MLWKYRIKTVDGEIQEGTLRTDSYQNAARELTEPGQQILSLMQCNELKQTSKVTPVPVEIDDSGWGLGLKDLLALLLLAGSIHYLVKRPSQWGPILPSTAASPYTINLHGQLKFEGPASSINQRAVRVDVYFPELGMVVSKKPAPLDVNSQYKDTLEILTSKAPSKCVVEVSQQGYLPYKNTIELSTGQAEVDLGLCKLMYRAPLKGKSSSSEGEH